MASSVTVVRDVFAAPRRNRSSHLSFSSTPAARPASFRPGDRGEEPRSVRRSRRRAPGSGSPRGSRGPPSARSPERRGASRDQLLLLRDEAEELDRVLADVGERRASPCAPHGGSAVKVPRGMATSYRRAESRTTRSAAPRRACAQPGNHVRASKRAEDLAVDLDLPLGALLLEERLHQARRLL